MLSSCLQALFVGFFVRVEAGGSRRLVLKTPRKIEHDPDPEAALAQSGYRFSNQIVLSSQRHPIGDLPWTFKKSGS